jgi:hypothetical protein
VINVAWTVDISLKSGKNVIVEDLQSVNILSNFDSTIKKTIKFGEFHLEANQNLTFAGKSSSISLSSNDIEYVQFDNND